MCQGILKGNWKGGRRIDRNGYVLIYSPNHPFTRQIKCVPEHRLVMEKQLGRYLLPTEIVHHKNHIKNDNRIENLELIASQSEHIKREFSTGGMLGSKRTQFKKGFGAIEGWSRDYEKCIVCKSSENRYNARGMCIICYNRWLLSEKGRVSLSVKE